MRSRPQGVTIAAILLVLLSLFGFPWPWLLLFPWAQPPPAIVIYTGFILGVVRCRSRSSGRIVDDESVELQGHHHCLRAQPPLGSARGIPGANRWNTST